MKMRELSRSETSNNKNKKGDGGEERTGPPLPNLLRMKKFDLNLEAIPLDSNDEDTESDYSNDWYEEYQQKARNNDKYVRIVHNFDYEFPHRYQDENVASNDDEDDGDAIGSSEDLEGDEAEEQDEGKHARMLQQNTGLPVEAFKGKKRKNDFVISEAYPVSAYNPSSDIIYGNGGISIQNLLDPLHGKSGFSNFRKSIHQTEKSVPCQAWLRKADREKLERNEQVLTLGLNEDRDPGCSAVGAIESESGAWSEFEEEITPTVTDNGAVEAQEREGARSLELNQQLQATKPRKYHPIGKGKQKIKIKYIDNKNRRMVTFTKRRDGLFKKANELCNICGVQAAIITITEARNSYVFGNPTVDSVLDRYLAETSAHGSEQVRELDEKYVDALVRLEAEKQRGELIDKVLAVAEGHEPNEGLGSEESKQIMAMIKEMELKPSSPGSQASTTKKPSF